VWDFAGDGYVHRLILSTAPTAGSTTNSPNSSSNTGQDQHYRAKLVEGGGAHSHTGTRDPRPPLSDEQEDLLVSGKLESAARHYNQLLAWQLEQNRLLYEARLRRIRESVAARGESSAGVTAGEGSAVSASGTAQKGKGTSSAKHPQSHGNSSWRENLVTSLRTERAKVAKQLDGAKERLQRAHREIAVLRELRAGLETNRLEWQRKADAAAGALREAQQTFQ
jgi:hypothetical protein